MILVWKKEGSLCTLYEGGHEAGSVWVEGSLVRAKCGTSDEAYSEECPHPITEPYYLGKARTWVQDSYKKAADVQFPDVTYVGINPTPDERWNSGLPHHPKSLEIYRAIEKLDLSHNDDHLDLSSGGDGDVGESLMFLMDMHFEDDDAG